MSTYSVNSRELDKKERTWGMLCHLTALLGITGVPFGHIFCPLIIWLLKKNDYPFVDEQGKESLNFQLSMTVYTLISALLIFIKIGFVLIIVLATVNLVLVIIASVKANSGETYQYPLKFRFIR